jgi:drug/metabolite transporter (DMT)-like permease
VSDVNLFQLLAICGMLSPIVYTVMWILGGILQPEYSHVRDDISSLFAVGALNQRLMQSFIITSSVLLFAFYLGLHEGINDGGGSMIGPLLFMTSSVLGILVAFFFPLDMGGEIITLKGKMHLLLVIGSGLLTIAGMIALWFRLQAIETWSLFATYSLLSAIVSLILVIISGIFIKSKYRGLLERFGVTPYQLYYFVLSLMVFLNN